MNPRTLAHIISDDIDIPKSQTTTDQLVSYCGLKGSEARSPEAVNELP